MDFATAVLQSIRNLDNRVRDLANTKPALQAWQVPALSGGWTNVGGLYATAGYWKDPWGTVHLRGRVSGGSAGTVAFTMPTGYRPEASSDFYTAGGGVVEIRANGDVYVVSVTSYVALDSVSLRAYS